MWTVLKLPELIRSDFICSGILEIAYFRQNQLSFRLYNFNMSHSTTTLKWDKWNCIVMLVMLGIWWQKWQLRHQHLCYPVTVEQWNVSLSLATYSTPSVGIEKTRWNIRWAKSSLIGSRSLAELLPKFIPINKIQNLILEYDSVSSNAHCN